MISSIFSRPGNIVKIGNCVSGTLSAPRDPIKRRIALATEAAWQQLERPEIRQAFQHDLQRKVFHHNRISFWSFTRFGFLSHTFENGKGIENYGLLQPTRQGVVDFSETFESLTRVGKGPHRRAFLAIMGIMAEQGIDEEEPSIYCAMLAKMDKEYDGPNFPTIISVSVSDQLAKDRVVKNRNGTQSITFSLQELDKYGYHGLPTLARFRPPREANLASGNWPFRKP
ncbi:hypothetical protein A3K48_03025 [candidate division WOR-1 bacterium RIFOXYA12_FULL_52_29]|uniref:Uncharacterized protein n=1 Tax=candidate division WOR-1 bacterium RIFOXYC12_FULL_54_18 TaxID=1802584 RepID=A0A1F4T5Y1_UNCSA|nr:MAG: hypothetical protein A3K44_03025 [candidate division WOR-1 bacterium RIFOXYA2_FULL_51_19]OGC17540.1 MAG: hypothetical protein A3K48_03025 [candidate division WOR-1 bacterium RIFOXYA12_FULL_52_29]OGC26397.1 MAG: hypothetical protein A3K32_03020 [candidate division WOR-1 bacterium RIFOXYB2_FULL_45_9]OGC27957.1 MAG: hypothetical protein A3K49_03025 [candidate division WOR-1 bacterium RIFOXYC12_FULL_54_18]OGC29756.1 MAG: hypothetical protein A2346_03310 [candidate division WOR-1 bacterium R